MLLRAQSGDGHRGHKRHIEPGTRMKGHFLLEIIRPRSGKAYAKQVGKQPADKWLGHERGHLVQTGKLREARCILPGEPRRGFCNLPDLQGH